MFHSLEDDQTAGFNIGNTEKNVWSFNSTHNFDSLSEHSVKLW